MGVRGKPLPNVRDVRKVQSLKTVPFQPLMSAPAWRPSPVVYWPVNVSKWRWSKAERLVSARRFRQFWAMDVEPPPPLLCTVETLEPPEAIAEPLKALASSVAFA